MLLSILAIIVTVAWIFPVYWMINSAFIPTAVLDGFIPQFFPSNPTLSNFSGSLADGSFFSAPGYERDDLERRAREAAGAQLGQQVAELPVRNGVVQSDVRDHGQHTVITTACCQVTRSPSLSARRSGMSGRSAVASFPEPPTT